MLIAFDMNVADLAINRKWLKAGLLNPAYRDLKRSMADDIRIEAEEHFGEQEVQVKLEIRGTQADIDAPIKATLDILQKAHVFQNDKQIRRLVVEITDRDDEPWYGIEVTPYEADDSP